MSTFDRYPFWHRYLTRTRLRSGALAGHGPAHLGRGSGTGGGRSPATRCRWRTGTCRRWSRWAWITSWCRTCSMRNARRAMTARRTTAPGTRRCRSCCNRRRRSSRTAGKFLIPTLHFQHGAARRSRKRWRQMMRRLGVTRRASDRAVDAAYAAQRELPGAAPGGRPRARSATLDETGEPGLVLVGRGYNIYDRGVNCDIPRKLRHRYGANVIPLDFLVTGREAVATTRTCTGSPGARSWKRRALAAGRPNLHLVYISNFKCGPDSYIKHFTRDAAGRAAAGAAVRRARQRRRLHDALRSVPRQ